MPPRKSSRARPGNLETVRLAMELMRRIPRNRKVTAAELQQQLADVGIVRDVRTIRRQLEMLAGNFGIERETTRPMGYSRKDRACGLSVVSMNENEALLLMLARQHMAALLPPSLMKAMDTFFNEARRQLDPFGDDQPAQQWLSKVRVVGESVRLIPPKLAAGVLETVSQALYANQWLELRYRNAEGRVSDNRVMPLGLAQQGPRLYLVCRYEGEAKDRSLALHRIQSVRATTLVFKRPRKFNLARFDGEGRFAFGDGTRVQLSFRIARAAGEQLFETPLSLDQTVQEEGDWLLVQATVVQSLQIDRWLYGFGPQIADVRKLPLEQATPAASSETARRKGIARRKKATGAKGG
jgi:predicted DNA-binding transcriptional regulator YafY